MYQPIIVHKNRNVTVGINLGEDVSGNTFSGVIRKDKSPDSTLLATWAIEFLTDGTDGEIVLTLQPGDTATIEHTNAYTDVKRVVGSEVLPVFTQPIQVIFVDSLTP